MFWEGEYFCSIYMYIFNKKPQGDIPHALDQFVPRAEELAYSTQDVVEFNICWLELCLMISSKANTRKAIKHTAGYLG